MAKVGVDRGSEGRAGSLDLVGGRTCLDFHNTASGRGGARFLNHLTRYDDLILWSRHAGVIDGSMAKKLRAEAAAHPRRGRAVLGRAIALREALDGVFGAVAAGRRAPKDGLAVLNRELANALAHARVSTRRGGFVWAWSKDDPPLDRPLWPIARSAADLLTAPELQRVKRCGGRDCGWLFLDTSKNNRRRWCEMEVCGNRAKARRYYARHRNGG
ncbi:MAG: ABATE domain-containing protein [Alphaproteobacteria bacterium]|nr:ABATE domain-containing protein [Alphaproteobacteria bacterium]